MTADEYQTAAARTLIDAPDAPFTDEELTIILGALELGAKAGKVMEYVKKAICHRHGFTMHDLGKLLVDTSEATSNLMNVDILPTQHYIFSGNEQMLLWCALGAGGEAGEVIESASMIGSFDLFNPSDMIKELGDLSWYLAGLATLIGVPLSEVFERNITKLKQRYPNGYASADSKARVDTDSEAAEFDSISAWDQWTDEQSRRT